MFDAQIDIHTAPDAIEASLEMGKYNHIWTSSHTRLKRLATIRKAKKVFKIIGGLQQNEYPSSREEVEYFGDKYLQAESFPKRSGLRGRPAAEKFVKEYGAILDVVTGRRAALIALSRLEDDWAELIAHLSGKRGAPVVYGNYEMIPICSAITTLRALGLGISDCTSDKIREIWPDLNSRRQTSIRIFIGRLRKLHSSSNVLPSLLPDLRPEDIPFKISLKKRATPSFHPDFKKLVDKFVHHYAHGISDTRFGTAFRQLRTRRRGKDRIHNLRVALGWFWHGLVALGVADGERPFNRDCLEEVVLIHDIVELCASGGLGFVCNNQTRRSRVLDVIEFLEWNSKGYSAEIPRSFYNGWNIRLHKNVETEDRLRKSTSCLKFIHSEELQRRFFMMPRHFFDEARPVIDEFHTFMRSDGNGISREQHRALELGILAALSAINTVYPARLRTLVQLKSWGQSPNIEFPDGNDRDCVYLNIPGKIVKNNKYVPGILLRPGDSVSPRTVLSWYLTDVHPLVLKYKHRQAALRQPELLFTGLNIETVRRYWQHHVPAETGLDLTPHMCRHWGASLLKANGVSDEEIAALLNITPGVVENNYAFVSKDCQLGHVMEVHAGIYRKLGI